MRDEIVDINDEGVLICIDKICDLNDNVRRVKSDSNVGEGKIHPNL